MDDATLALARVLDAFPLPVVLLDRSGRAARGNRSFEGLLLDVAGITSADLPLPFFEFLEEREAFRLSSFFSRFVKGQEGEAAVESPVKLLDGKAAWFRFHLSEPGILSGATPLVFCAIEDISRQKSREDVLQSAKEEAEKAVVTRGQFLANMSHEIRTPIQTVLGMIELLEETRLDREQREYLRQARFSADVLLSLITDILDFSKIESGRLELEVIDFDPRRCVEQAADMIALEAHAKALELIIDVADDIPPLARGDPTRLRQVLVNLIKNAVKFTARGEVYVSARRERRAAGETLRIEVSDTGIGVPPDVRPRLFSSFHQADASHTRRFGGTGLGLAISKHLMELMGGSISFKPADPEGSVFIVELPLVESPFALAEGLPPLSGSILVVDDRLNPRLIETNLAASFGLEAEGCPSGQRALERLRERAAEGRPFDLCAIDQDMRSMDGWRLAAAIASDPAISGTRLALLTPEGGVGAEAKMKLLNWFACYVSKPVKRGEFHAALSSALAASAPRALDSGVQELEPAIDPGPGRADTASPADPRPAVKGAKVLVAEDHLVNQSLFRLILERAGCEVAVVPDGAAAAALCRERAFDIAFMDIQMPVMNGYEAARAIRDSGSRMPIVAVTAGTAQGERQRCIEAGMNDTLIKPFRKNDILDMLEFWLNRSGPGLPLAEAPSRAPSVPEREENEVFDFQAVLETFLGRREAVVSLIDRFVDRTRASVKAIDGALERGEAEEAAREAHGIKGSAWNLSARALGNAARDLEAAALSGDPAAAEEAAGRLKERFFEFAMRAKRFAARDGAPA